MISDQQETIPAPQDEARERTRAEAKTRKSAETRRRIMETASELIDERGNTVFKMSEVSRRCGMSKGALYYYFSDKQDLVTAIFEDEVNNLVKALDQAVEDTDSASEALRRMCDEFVGRVSGGGILAMALVRELAITREPGSYAQNDKVRHIVGVVAELLERGKREGAVRSDVDSVFAAVAACGAFTFVAVGASERFRDGRPNPSVIADRLYDFVVRGLTGRSVFALTA